MRRRLALVAAVALPAVVALAAPATSVASASTRQADPATPGFGVPRVVDPIHVYGEPDLALNPMSGAVQASGPQGTGTQRSIWNISVDGGDSYRIVQNVPKGALVSGTEPTKSLVAPGGGDTEIQIGQNGRTFFSDLAALACFSTITTTDDGATTSTANPVGCPAPGGDRQWIALYDPKPSDNPISPYTGPKPLAYQEYADQTMGDTVAQSTDGTTYLTKSAEYGDDGTHNPNHGVPLVDQHTGDFLGLTTRANPDMATNKARPDDLSLVVGVPNADGTLKIHYNDFNQPLTGSPETLFPVLAQDSSRNLYAAWVQRDTYQVYYSWTPPGADNEWNHWSAPTQVSQAPANVNVFPWIVAGKDGIIDVAWYGTDQTLAQLGSTGPSAKKNQTWQLFFNQVTGANTAAPAQHQVVAAPHPMHYNDICLLGTLCISGAGNRNQADFFKVVLGSDGRARIIYTDSSNLLSQTVGMDSAADHSGAALDTVVTQESGVNAVTGDPLVPRETTAPQTSVSDPKGDALFKPLGGTNVPAADVTNVAVSRTGSTLHFAVTTASGSLGDAATAAVTPFAELVLRWQVGNTLYHAGVEEPAGGLSTSYYAGTTKSVDLCSVSGCKPNYLTYDAAAPNGQAVAGSKKTTPAGTVYTIDVPVSAVGNPPPTALLEEVQAFVTVAPHTAAVTLTNDQAFADEVPLQIEGTRTFNYQAVTPADQAGSPVVPEAPAAVLLPLAGVGLGALLVARRRRLARR